VLRFIVVVLVLWLLPELMARELRALRKCRELCPCDLRMNSAA
jgi:hypothetical protein